MKRLLVSACLLGRPVRYDGSDNATGDDRLSRWNEQGRVVPFCPEVAGGLATPRPPAEIIDGRGGDVLDGRARLETDEGADVTEAFLAGAEGALRAALEAGVSAAILKEGSPSCGSGYIYDGTFSGTRLEGARGVTAALLERHGIPVFAEHQLDAVARWLDARL
jgi:uncharacterized protein YbbK (DUF523 family)